MVMSGFDAISGMTNKYCYVLMVVEPRLLSAELVVGTCMVGLA